MTAALAGYFVSPAHNAGMARVKPNFKKGPPRHFIRAWRKHRGLTLEDLAEQVGVTHGAISQLERGETNYTQPMLEALAVALFCNPADLIMRDPESPIWSIFDTIQKLEPEQQRQITQIVETFRKAS